MPHFESAYALTIGIGDDLPITVKDANAVYEFLISKNRCAYHPDNVKLLCEENATRSRILESLAWLASQATENDTVLIFYSGHGEKLPEYHLIPFGYDENRIEESAILATEFTDAIQKIRCSKLVVLFDCCFAGGQGNLELAKHNTTSISKEIIGELAKGHGRVIIASSRSNELSWTGSEYSEFTKAVLESLAGYGSFENDGYARVLDLAMYVGRFVPERTKDRQHPIIKVTDLENNFALGWYAGGKTQKSPVKWQHDTSFLIPTQTTDYEVEAWKNMLINYRRNLLLIERRMSEFVVQTAIPLDLVRDKEAIEGKISTLENKLRHV